jgi:predicted NAD-dependent protein-ADP-ribosyltransferase YbiA (DUF1768 family)
MDIGSGHGYPASSLSNFSPHPFVLDGVKIASMEGFLQSLKFKEFLMQAEICKLVGRAAKLKGKNKNWQQWQRLYWNGRGYMRDSADYQNLLTFAYIACYTQNEGIRKALSATGDAILRHSIGRTDERETVLTQREFTSRLHWLRDNGDEILKKFGDKPLFIEPTAEGIKLVFERKDQ